MVEAIAHSFLLGLVGTLLLPATFTDIAYHRKFLYTLLSNRALWSPDTNRGIIESDSVLGKKYLTGLVLTDDFGIVLDRSRNDIRIVEHTPNCELIEQILGGRAWSVIWRPPLFKLSPVSIIMFILKKRYVPVLDSIYAMENL